MKKLLFLAIAVASLFAASCGKKGTLAEQTADQLCNCQTAKDYKQLTDSLKDKDEETKTAALERVATLYMGLASCISNDLKKQIAALQFTDKDKFEENLNQAITAKCTSVTGDGILEIIKVEKSMNK